MSKRERSIVGLGRYKQTVGQEGGEPLGLRHLRATWRFPIHFLQCSGGKEGGIRDR